LYSFAVVKPTHRVLGHVLAEEDAPSTQVDERLILTSGEKE